MALHAVPDPSGSADNDSAEPEDVMLRLTKLADRLEAAVLRIERAQQLRQEDPIDGEGPDAGG